MITRKHLKSTACAVGITLMPCANAFSNPVVHSSRNSIPNYQMDDSILLLSRPAAWQLEMQRSNEESSTTRRIESLSAVSIADDWNLDDEKKNDIFDSSTFLESWLFPVLSTSFMITGNTVGAGMLVLPELAAGPGMGISSSIFAGAFLVNLISGLLIAEVGINQHDSSGNDVPSSFKDFAEINLNSSSAATIISCISIFVNALVMAFNTVKVGDIGSAMASLPSEAISMGWVLCIAALVGTQTFTSLSAVTSLLVTGLFFSFAGLLLPGLAHMTADPLTILTTPGTATDVVTSAGQLAPVILMSLVYQNIVPTVTKLLDYDRTKTTIAIGLGSFIPLVMYVAWAFAANGGGIDTSSVGLDGPLMTCFSLSTIAGSSIGCVMSLSEEIETFLKKEKDDDEEEVKDSKADDKFSLPAVLASVSCAWIAAQFFESDLNSALKVAGSFGSPLLYGVLPVAMAFTQRQEQNKNHVDQMPVATLGLLGVASTGFVGNELFQSASDALSMLPL